jgi:hypothetical protein
MQRTVGYIYLSNGHILPHFCCAGRWFSHDSLSDVRNYQNGRLMEFLIDAGDWLYGYPYESVVPSDLVKALEN